MGTWGVHSFENDAAADFVAALEAAKYDPAIFNADRVEAALDAVFMTPVSDLDAEAAATGIAAAEVTAAALGQPGAGALDPYELKEHMQVQDHGVGKALAVLSQVRRDGSELAGLWSETDEAGDWLESLSNLEARLKAAASAFKLSVEYTRPPSGASELNAPKQGADAPAESSKDLLRNGDGRDPATDELRRITRKLDMLHTDLLHTRDYVFESLDTLTARLEKLERAGK